MKSVKKTVILLLPLLLFVILLVPYSWVNQRFLVEWFGCGCPVIDANGEAVPDSFNANDVTLLFWLFVSVCTTVISVFLSKRILRDEKWQRVLYVLGVLVISLLISYRFYQMMMWT